MAIKDYIPISEELSDFLGQLLGKYKHKNKEYAFAGGGNYVFFAPEEGCTNCQGTCSGSCSGTCDATCSGTCTGVRCQTGCSGGCTGNCYGSCTGSCTGSCSDGCSGSCRGECTGICENYCTTICQTFCQYAQTFSVNNGPNKGTGMGNSFFWTNTNTQGEKIQILATDWNKLAEYINDAQVYCSTGTTVNVTNNKSSGDLITAAIWNNLNDGLAKINSRVSTVTKNVDKIKASEVNALATKYNEAQIRSSLPSNPNGASENLCCQRGMVAKTTWGSQQPCTNGQTPKTEGTNYICSKRE